MLDGNPHRTLCFCALLRRCIVPDPADQARLVPTRLMEAEPELWLGKDEVPMGSDRPQLLHEGV